MLFSLGRLWVNTCDFYGQAQKRSEFEDVFVDDLQILVWKTKPQKPEFWAYGNDKLKYQYTHKLQDPYYVTIAHNVLQNIRQ